MDLEQAVVVTDGLEWVGDLPDVDDLRVQVAPWENTNFNRVLNRRIRALPAALRAEGNIDPAAYYRCVGFAMAKTILFGWENLKVGGADKAFDPAFAETLLTDQKYRPFRDAVTAAAQRVQQGRNSEDKAMEGNSSTSSAGSGTGEGT